MLYLKSKVIKSKPREVIELKQGKTFFEANKTTEGIMRKRIMVAIVTAIALVIGITAIALAADTKTVNLNATIPSQSTLNVAISKVVGTVFTTATAVNFGTLTLDTVNSIYKTSDGSYYAVDCGVNSNATAWTVTHTITSMANGSANLNGNINVTFMNQQTSSTGVQLAKLSYTASNNRVTNKADITAGGWLRIYYGLGTGSGDATGVTPIPATALAGAYAGTVTLTLAP
jgi:hypothetical protein